MAEAFAVDRARPSREASAVPHPEVAFGPPRREGYPTVSQIVDRLLVGAYVLPREFAGCASSTT